MFFASRFFLFLTGQHKCPANGQRIRLVATHSCCHYYECINGHLKEQVCPLHKLYSVETKSCENFQVVVCKSRKNCVDPCKIPFLLFHLCSLLTAQAITIILHCVNLNLFVAINPMVTMLINIDRIVNFIILVSKVERLITRHVNMVIAFLFNIKNVYLLNK